MHSQRQTPKRSYKSSRQKSSPSKNESCKISRKQDISNKILRIKNCLFATPCSANASQRAQERVLIHSWRESNNEHIDWCRPENEDYTNRKYEWWSIRGGTGKSFMLVCNGEHIRLIHFYVNCIVVCQKFHSSILVWRKHLGAAIKLRKFRLKGATASSPTKSSPQVEPMIYINQSPYIPSIYCHTLLIGAHYGQMLKLWDVCL